MSFEYPDHPIKNRIDPTRDASVENPFVDPAADAAAEAIAENPYTASAVDDPVPYKPRDFVTTYQGRGGLICTLGLAGSISWMVATTGLLVGAFGRDAVAGWLLLLSTSMLMLGLPMSWAAWLMGRHDLAAMKAGAMEQKGWRSTRIGWRTGMWGTLGGWAGVILLVAWTMVSIIQEG